MILVYLLLVGSPVLFVAALITAFAARGKATRRNARRAAVAIWAGTALLIAAVFGAFYFFFSPQTPSLDELASRFPGRRADLDAILKMSDVDRTLTRIDPEFLYESSGDGQIGRQFMAGDAAAPLSTERWDEYRSLFRRNGIEQGIARDEAGDAFVMVRSQGLLDRGDSAGYVHCSGAIGGVSIFRYEPCVSSKSEDRHQFTGSGPEGFAFKKIGDRWYAYDQGPG